MSQTGKSWMAAVLLAGCAVPNGADALPDAVREIATRAASNTPDRLLVVRGTFGDTVMSFATRQALVTAGVVVHEDAGEPDTAFAVLHFEAAQPTDDGWRIRTTREPGADGLPSDEAAVTGLHRVEWTVRCADAGCEVTDSTSW